MIVRARPTMTNDRSLQGSEWQGWGFSVALNPGDTGMTLTDGRTGEKTFIPVGHTVSFASTDEFQQNIAELKRRIAELEQTRLRWRIQEATEDRRFYERCLREGRWLAE